MELEVTESHEIAFLVVLYLMRTLRTVHNLRKRLVITCILARSITENRVSVSIIKIHCHLVLLPCLIKFHALHKRLVRGYCKDVFINLFPVSYQFHLHSFLDLGSIYTKEILSLALRLEVHGCKSVAGLHSLDVADTVVVLGELLHLIRLVPVVVRLIVGIGTHHQFDIVS